MITVTIKTDSISLKDMKAIAEGVNKIGTSLFERTNLFLEVGTVLVDDDSQNIVTVAADSNIADKS